MIHHDASTMRLIIKDPPCFSTTDGFASFNLAKADERGSKGTTYDTGYACDHDDDNKSFLPFIIHEFTPLLGCRLS